MQAISPVHQRQKNHLFILYNFSPFQSLSTWCMYIYDTKASISFYMNRINSCKFHISICINVPPSFKNKFLLETFIKLSPKLVLTYFKINAVINVSEYIK